MKYLLLEIWVNRPEVEAYRWDWHAASLVLPESKAFEQLKVEVAKNNLVTVRPLPPDATPDDLKSFDDRFH